MRSIEHPGPTAAQRLQALPCRLRHERLTLAPGASLLDTLAAALDASGADGAVLAIDPGAMLAPIAWVLPHTAATPEHAVYFSPRHAQSGPARLLAGRITLGRRDGAVWLHCHAEWALPDGQVHLGHLLPQECLLATPLTVQVAWMHGAAFEVTPDPETRFTLFLPQAQPRGPGGPPDGPPAWALRLAPNVDVADALTGFCRLQGLARARLLGGVGSTVGAVFSDGRDITAHITESFVEHGLVGAHLPAEIDIAMVDHLGGQHRGRLAAAANPVLVTMEVVVEALPD